MTPHCVIIDGEESLAEFCAFQRVPHVAWHEGVESELPEGMIPVLNGTGESLVAMLRGFLRLRRKAFVLPGVAHLSDDSKARLSISALKRKGAVYVLGGMRLLPICAGIREVVSGGTLGVVQSAVMTCGAEKRPWSVLPSLASWLAGGADAAACRFDDREAFRGQLAVDIVCSAGVLRAEGSCQDGSGVLEVIREGENTIRRVFPKGISGLRQELNVLAGGGVLSLFCRWTELETGQK